MLAFASPLVVSRTLSFATLKPAISNGYSLPLFIQVVPVVLEVAENKLGILVKGLAIKRRLFIRTLSVRILRGARFGITFLVVPQVRFLLA